MKHKKQNKYLVPLIMIAVVVVLIVTVVTYASANHNDQNDQSGSDIPKLIVSPSSLKPSQGCVLASPADPNHPSSYVCHMELSTDSKDSIDWFAMRSGLGDAKLLISSTNVQQDKPVDVDLIVPQNHCNNPTASVEAVVFAQGDISSNRTGTIFSCH